ncbi:acyl-CoA-dependent ceramide synthase [Scheffersomyces xylosifermentans]|uniref:acyl-CoA-dependent ceramide synthase n=1 Tax=Scheffersomyces xylosifermentans TaxID=1304137 RepID=UPI00315C6EEE
MSSPDSLAPPSSEQTHRRRGSSLGHINVGDTMSPGLSTMHTTRRQRKMSDARIVALSTSSSTDTALLKKIIIAFRELTYRHTWIIPLLVLLASYSTYYLSGPNTEVHKFLERLVVPSYKIPGTNQYGKGENDFYFVFFYAIFFTFLREFVMVCFLRPIARALGVKKEAKVKRFMEQAYAIFYYGLVGPAGLLIMRQLPLWYFNTTEFYVSYPHYTHDFWFKIYYLGQAAFWFQQSIVLILRLEKPRKDYYELVLHHIITIALIWCSYRFHFTWMGIAVFVSMDVSDFFLATSKTLNYINSPFTGPFFVVFVSVWIYLRHWINLRILYSVLTEFRTVGEWELNWDTQQYKCWISQPIVFFLIGALQLVNAYWLFLIFRILWRYIDGGVTKDERSDDEDSEGESSEEESKKSQ